MRRNYVVFRLVIDALMGALYFLLAKYHLTLAPNVVLTLAIVPIIFVSVYFGLPDVISIVLVGEFLSQLTGKYGLSPTTPLWIIPPLFRAVTIALFSRHYERRNRRLKVRDEEEGAVLDDTEHSHQADHLENHIVIYFIAVILGSVLTSVANTGAIYLDAYIMGYGLTYTLVTTIVRFAVSVATAAVLGGIMIPVLKTFRRVRVS